MQPNTTSKPLSEYLVAATRELEDIRFEPSERDTLANTLANTHTNTSITRLQTAPQAALKTKSGRGFVAVLNRRTIGILGGVLCASLAVMMMLEGKEQPALPLLTMPTPPAQQNITQPSTDASSIDAVSSNARQSQATSKPVMKALPRVQLAGVEMLDLSDAELVTLGVELRVTDSTFLLRPTRVDERSVMAMPRYVRFYLNARRSVKAVSLAYIRWWRPVEHGADSVQTLVSLSLASESVAQQNTSEDASNLLPVLVTTTDNGTLLPLPSSADAAANATANATADMVDANTLIPVRVRCEGQAIALWYEKSPRLATALPERYRRIAMPVSAREETGSGLVHVSTSPNPVRDALTLRFELAAAQRVTANLHRITGQRVATLTEQRCEAGMQEISIQMPHVEAGIYLVVLATERGRTATQRVMVER
jgi:hypothetical protein